MRIFGSGRVEFSGERNVCEAHPAPAAVPRERAQRLLNGLLAAGFETMPDYLREDRTDAPGATLSLSDRGHGHTVRHYLGMEGVPEQLPAFEEAVDRVSGDARWLPVGREGACTGPDGRRHAFDRTGRSVPLPDGR